MAPHAMPVDERYSPVAALGSHLSLEDSDIPQLIDSKRSHLDRYDDDEIHDLVGVGFGPASLAIAVALHDALDAGDPTLSTHMPKVRFLEKQHRFAWHAGMLLPGAKMQISFVKDLATLRNPRSEFTFLNYLHQKGRLVSFTNLSTFLPQRIEYEDYMRWCAEQFGNVVDYSNDVQRVEVGKINSRTGAVDFFVVTSLNHETGRVAKLKARHVVIAAGGKPNIPSVFPAHHPRVIHSSQYATTINHIFPPGSSPKRVAVIGAGQSAAEVFFNIPTRFPDAQSVLLVRGAALKPSDDSPFVNEVFNPEKVDDIFSQDPTLRAEAIKLDRATNYGVVRLELLEEMYGTMYSYRIKDLPEESWPHRLLSRRSVTRVTENTAPGQPALRLHIHDGSGHYSAITRASHLARPHGSNADEELLDVDLVVVASGYLRNAHEELLQDLQPLMRAPANAPQNDNPLAWPVNRDYSVQFPDGAVHPDAGIWLQGCNERTHGLSDSLLSILAVRGGEMVDSIFGAGSAASFGGKRLL